MKTNRILTLTSLLVALVLLSSGAGLTPVAAQNSLPQDAIQLQIEPQKLTWLTDLAYREVRLVITAPDETHLERSFTAGQSIQLSISEVKLADGGYHYDLLLLPPIDPFLEAQIRLAAEDPELRAALAALLPPPVVMSGAFSVLDGAFIPPQMEEDEPKDVVHADDVIITGSLCVGFDCTEGLSFGFDTIILKENNLRLYFDDTSTTVGFPANDWTIIINDSASGGMSYFAIQDRTNSLIPFMIEGGADANSIHVDDQGDIGLGTATPLTELHILDGDTPTIRLEQNLSLFTPQTWDIGANEANFFVRDTTDTSKLPFRIVPGAPTNSIYIASNGNVGLGTGTPTEKLHVAGNIRADGYVIEYSDVNAKENFAPVSGSQILDKIAGLKILSWNYKQEADSVRHIGPMAQDFFAAFGLGADDRHIAGLDVNGVTLAAIQELIKQNASQAAEIQALKARNAELEARLERLEKALLP